MRFMPKTLSCLQLAQQRFHKYPLCENAFRSCCEFVQQKLDQDQDQELVLGRHGQSDQHGVLGCACSC